MSEILQFIQQWYCGQCDGDWEHLFGVRIATLDNPGWRVDIDLVRTNLEGKIFHDVSIDRTGTDWLRCSVDGRLFKIRCGPTNLVESLNLFREWVESQK